MKHLLRRICLFICIIAVFGCTQKQIITESIVSGKILNPTSDFVVVSYNDESDTITLNESGEFIVKLTVNESAYYRFWHEPEYASIFLVPGDSVYVELNTEEFDESIIFSGKGKEVNNYLAKKIILNETLSIGSSLFVKPLDEFVIKVDSNSDARNEMFSAFLAENPKTDKKFIAIEKASIVYDQAVTKMKYPDYHRYYAKDHDFSVDRNYYDFINALDFNDSTLIEVPDYLKSINSYLAVLYAWEIEADSTLLDQKNASVLIKCRLANEILIDNAVNECVMNDIISSALRYGNIKGIKAVLDDFVANCKNREYADALIESYEKWENISEGKIAPTFSFVDIKGDTVALQDFLGTFVYIDVWATWCGPCKKETPYFEDLKEKFAGEKISFVSVSVDGDKSKWEKYIIEKNLSGTLLFSARDKQFSKNYLLMSIPRFILIDMEGKIIDANAERPSSGISEILAGLIAE